METKNKIGFIGQGWIGKNYADDFENRGYEVVRYALEEPYVNNREAIADCNIVFIAVPTPTTDGVYSYEPVEKALENLAPKTTAVIKSTLLPRTTKEIQQKFTDLYVMHSPEFLMEASAAYDASHPNRNIVGIPEDTAEFKQRAEEVLAVLPQSPYNKIMDSNEAELIKYIGNCFLYSKVIMMNTFYDVVTSLEGDWGQVIEAVTNDPRIGDSHTNPVHDGGRGAGGHCFIKDFEAFRTFYKDNVSNNVVDDMLVAMVTCNNSLLKNSGKNLDLLEGVYGKNLQP